MDAFVLYRARVIRIDNMAVLAANICCSHRAVTILFNDARRTLAVTCNAVVCATLEHINPFFCQRSRRNGGSSDDNDNQGQYQNDDRSSQADNQHTRRTKWIRAIIRRSH
jgi:hypothetical protein